MKHEVFRLKSAGGVIRETREREARDHLSLSTPVAFDDGRMKGTEWDGPGMRKKTVHSQVSTINLWFAFRAVETLD